MALRAKAEVAPAGDPAEAAADRLADRALAAQPRCACGGVPGPDGECASCRLERLRTAAPRLVEDALGTPGRPLDASTRAFFEPRLGADLGDVRVHTGTRAAEAARGLGARAFALGSEMAFGPGEYAPASTDGRRVLAHELAHVVQQDAGTPKIRRLVRNRMVSCRTTGLTGGVPAGTLSGADAVATIQAADAVAIDLATRAENRLHDQLAAFGTPGYAADATLDAALMTRFGLALATAGDRPTIAIVEREIRAVRRFLESGNIFYVCRDAGCDPGDWAFTFVGEHTIRLCRPFWNAPNANQQGATILHEAMHLWWDQIDDHGHRPLHNAHCFEQLALDVAGLSADITPDFAGACVV
jgi:hypothetical protein